ncbi:MAG: DUF4097 domain-containing protein [Clostridiales bacterium]|nr:DUF4097 domain-containing protein [Clostridiales bacterium]
MKQTTKIWLITAASLILIGILAFAGVMTRIHWDFYALGTGEFETSTVAVNEEFRNISITSDTENIIFLPSDSEECSVEFYEWKNVKLSASVQDDTLSINVLDTESWYNCIGFRLGTPEITVYLPQAEYEALSIKENTGDILIPNDFTFESVYISASTGNVACFASCAGLLRIKTYTGNIQAEEISAGELDLSVSTGEVVVRSVDCAGNVGVYVDTGRVELMDVSCKSVISNGSTGRITMENVIAEEAITVRRSTGDVRFEQCDGAEFLVATDTGNVTGNLLSEKVFIAQSDVGRVEVPETVTGGKCKITTSTGDILISIK